MPAIKRLTRLRTGVVLWLGVTVADAEPPVPDPPVIPPPAERREPALKQFPIEFVRNFGALFSKENVKPLLIGGLATGVATIPNKRLEGYFRDKDQSPLRHPGDIAGAKWVTVPSLAGFLLISRTTDNRRLRSFAYTLAQGYAVNQALIGGIKTVVSSERPNGQGNASFPSGHTSGAFTFATIVSHHYGKKAGIPAYMAAVYMGYARLDDRAHRLTDVVADAALGYIVGRTVSRRSGFDRNRRVDFGVTVPPGGGAALTLNFNLGGK